MVLIFLITAITITVSFKYSYSTESTKGLNDIVNLIYKYENVHSKKEKEEFLGTYIVFHRRDLELLQLNKLSDVLKLIPLGNFSPDRLGLNYWSFAGGYIPPVKFFLRLYLDDHELSSIDNGTPFLIYDDYPLDNINKIEIYITPSSSLYSVENGVVLIKMYSKKPSFEKTSMFKVGIDSQSSNIYTFSVNKTIEGIEFNLTTNYSNIKFPKEYISNNFISRDQSRYHIYSKMETNSGSLQISISKVERNLFGAFSLDFSPDIAKLKATDLFIAFKRFLLKDKSLKFVFSYDMQSRNYIEANYDVGILPIPIFSDKRIIVFLNKEKELSKLSSKLEKSFTTKNFDIKLGINANLYTNYIDFKEILEKTKDKRIKEYINLNEADYIKSASFISSYIDMIYKISKHIYSNLSYEVQKLNWDKLNNKYAHNYKFGILMSNSNFKSKLIFSQEYIIPPISILESIRRRKNSENAILIKYRNIMFENNIRLSSFSYVTYTVFKSKISNSIRGFRSYDGFEKNYRKNDKNREIVANLIIFNGKVKNNFYTISVWNLIKDNFEKLSPTLGANILFRGENKRFNYFLQLLYRKGLKIKNTYLSDSYDVSFGLSVKLLKDIIIKFKAENIFNSSTKAVFFSNKNTIIYNTTYRNFVLFLERYFWFLLIFSILNINFLL